MVRIIIIGFSFVALAGVAASLDLSVGAFYAPGRVYGDATGLDDAYGLGGGGEFDAGGFKGRVTMSVYEGLDLAFSLGYNDFTYRNLEGLMTFPEVDVVLSIPTWIFTAGADYEFPLGAVRPYVGGGGAFVRERAEAYSHSTTDWYPGVYVQAGVRYGFGGRWSVEAAPRYTYVFDEPAVEYDGLHEHDFVRSEDHSQLVEFMVGVNFNI
jgi:hypothetical protein